jgi:hypothetical protein
LAQIEAKMALSWIEFEQHVALVEAANALMGPDASREMWRKIINDTMGMPILRGFAAAVLRLRRNDPAALVSQAQRVYGHLTRGVGRVHYEPHPDAGGGDLVLTGFPGDRFPTSAYFIGLCGCSHALLDAREISASVELADMQALGCRIRTRWSGPVGGPLERD